MTDVKCPKCGAERINVCANGIGCMSCKRLYACGTTTTPADEVTYRSSECLTAENAELRRRAEVAETALVMANGSVAEIEQITQGTLTRGGLNAFAITSADECWAWANLWHALADAAWEEEHGKEARDA